MKKRFLLAVLGLFWIILGCRSLRAQFLPASSHAEIYFHANSLALQGFLTLGPWNSGLCLCGHTAVCPRSLLGLFAIVVENSYLSLVTGEVSPGMVGIESGPHEVGSVAKGIKSAEVPKNRGGHVGEAVAREAGPP